MKLKLTVLGCVLALLASGTPAAWAQDSYASAESGAIAADIIVVRPFCLLATILGSAVFVVGLPIAATSKSVRHSAHALVVRPAHATFSRPLGDMDALSDW